MHHFLLLYIVVVIFKRGEIIHCSCCFAIFFILRDTNTQNLGDLEGERTKSQLSSLFVSFVSISTKLLMSSAEHLSVPL